MMYYRRDYKPFYDDRGDYNTNAPSYYDYLAKNNKDYGKLVDTINKLLRQRVDFKETASISPAVLGDWLDDDVEVVTNDLKLSNVSGNTLVLNSDGLYSNGTVNANTNNGIPILDNIINHGGQITNENIMNAPFLANVAGVNNSNLQGVYLDTGNMEWYVTNSDGKSDEGFIIIRNTYDGDMISNMYLPSASHGQANWFEMIGDIAYWYFIKNGAVYRIKYDDYTTKNSDDWEQVIDPSIDTNHVIHGFDYYNGINKQAFVWRHVDNDIYTIYAQRATHEAGGDFNFYGDIASINITQFIPSTKDNSMQGTSVMNKADVTGDYKDESNFYIFVSYGYWSVKSEILVLEYNQDNNSIAYKTIISNMDKLVRRPQEKHIFELEGLSHLQVSIGDSHVGGLIFTNAAGRSGSYMNRIYGFINDKLLNYLNAFSSEYKDEINRRYSDDEEIDKIWKYGQGSFVIRANEWSKLKDRPYRWSGNSKLLGGYAYLDTVGKRDNQGDIIQTLTIPAYGNNPTEVYQRFINYSFAQGYYGADTKPYIINPWQPLTNGVYYAKRRLVGGVDNAIYKLSENVDYYIPKNTDNLDYEGLPSDNAFSLSNKMVGATEGVAGIIQVATIYNVTFNKLERFTRQVIGHISEYGAGLIDKTDETPWFHEIIDGGNNEAGS